MQAHVSGEYQVHIGAVNTKSSACANDWNEKNIVLNTLYSDYGIIPKYNCTSKTKHILEYIANIYLYIYNFWVKHTCIYVV